jgi:hypothetical protein
MSGEGHIAAQRGPDPMVAATLGEREAQYGVFIGSASIAQALKAEMFDSPEWSRLKADQREALQMIASKIGRILNGYPDHIDSWHDIAGFAQLVANRLVKEREITR